MFKHVEALPSPQRQFSPHHGNAQLGGSQGGADVRRHIVRTFRRVPVEPGIGRREARKILIQIEQYIRVGIFLDGERGAGMPDEQRQQARLNSGRGYPLFDLRRKLIETRPRSAHRDLMRMLLKRWGWHDGVLCGRVRTSALKVSILRDLSQY